ncbi:MAG: DUF697 domain-containing protein [Bacillota bacterium]|nr:DUF697 domain-containing protein [Bacillota bacterium]
MSGFIKKIMVTITAFLTLLFILFVINQTSQAVSLATGIHPVLGQIVLYLLLAVYAAVIIVPLFLIFKRPLTLFPPEDTEGEEYRRYLQQLAKRLSRNPHVKDDKIDPEDREAIDAALKELDILADSRLKEAAGGVFIMTAISQYGALDAVIVALSQFRMIWQVSLLYNQRPNLRELAYLYGNVFATAFLATRIENLELLEDQLEPVIASIMGSSLSSLTPAFNTAANLITNSIIQGSSNAYLTLRVGVITKQYCSSLVKPEKTQLRHAAAVQAAALLAKVLSESTYIVTKAVIKATAKAGKRPFRYGQNLITQTSKKTYNAGKTTFQKGENLARGLGDAVKSSGRRIKYYFVKEKPKPEEE